MNWWCRENDDEDDDDDGDDYVYGYDSMISLPTKSSEGCGWLRLKDKQPTIVVFISDHILHLP